MLLCFHRSDLKIVFQNLTLLYANDMMSLFSCLDENAYRIIKPKLIWAVSSAFLRLERLS